VKLEKDSPRRRRKAARAEAAAAAPAAPISTRRIVPSAPGAMGSAWRSITWFHARSLLRSVPFLAIAAIGLVNVIMSCWYADQTYDTKTWALSWIMSEAANGGAGLFMIVLLTFYAGELVWRERQVSLDQVLDASPVPTAAVLLGKFSAMLLVLAAFAACSVIGGVLVQLAKGFPLIDVRVYALETFAVNFPGWISFELPRPGSHESHR
jgi:ABC-type transport system involved in multi-copper enzyme maturation permease subunit